MRLAINFGVRCCKITEAFLASFIVGICRCFFGVKNSQANPFPVDLNSRTPFRIATDEVHALQSARIIRAKTPHVAKILGNGCRAQIGAPVVQTISVAVVNVLSFLRSAYQAVHQDTFAISSPDSISRPCIKHRSTALENCPTVGQNDRSIVDINDRPSFAHGNFDSSETHRLEQLKRIHARQFTQLWAVEGCA